jgi:hypothetical protein
VPGMLLDRRNFLVTLGLRTQRMLRLALALL